MSRPDRGQSMSTAEQLHAFETDEQFQQYLSGLYEEWRNRSEATEDFDEWKVAEIRRLRKVIEGLDETLCDANGGWQAEGRKLDAQTDALRAENERLQEESALNYELRCKHFARATSAEAELEKVKQERDLYLQQLGVSNELTRKERADVSATVGELSDVVDLQEKLLVCYRTGDTLRAPSIIDKLRAARALLAEKERVSHE